jgi:hypothetical protein
MKSATKKRWGGSNGSGSMTSVSSRITATSISVVSLTSISTPVTVFLRSGTRTRTPGTAKLSSSSGMA